MPHTNQKRKQRHLHKPRIETVEWFRHPGFAGIVDGYIRAVREYRRTVADNKLRRRSTWHLVRISRSYVSRRRSPAAKAIAPAIFQRL